MLLDNPAKQLADHRFIKALFMVKHHGLIPVMALLQLLLEKPALNRRQHDVSLNMPLIDFLA
ncbi:hypothetical protein D3C84_1014430 [compost metagenome]